MRKFFQPVIPTPNFPNTANVYSFDVEWKTNVETTEAALYSSIPCYGHPIVHNKLETMLGIDAQGRWKVLFPLTFNGSAVTIKEGYTMIITPDDGITRKLKVENVKIFASTHIEVEANEDDAYRQ